MSRFIFILFLVFLPFVIPVQAAPYDVWSSYYNLRSASQIVDAGDRVFALMNDNVVVYDVKTGEVKTVDKVSEGLSDAGVAFIGYSRSRKSLVIVYQNGNIDVWRVDRDEVVNVPQFKDNPDNVFGLNNLFVNDDDAVISTDEGVIWLSVKDAVIIGRYAVGKCSSGGVFGGYIYAGTTADGTKRAALSSNLLDSSVWQTFGGGEVTDMCVLGDRMFYVIAYSYSTNNYKIYGLWSVSPKEGKKHVLMEKFTDLTGNEHRVVALRAGNILEISKDDITNPKQYDIAEDYQVITPCGNADGYWTSTISAALQHCNYAQASGLVPDQTPIEGDGPFCEYPYFMRYCNGKLYVAGGRTDPDDKEHHTYNAMYMTEDGVWHEMERPTEEGGWLKKRVEVFQDATSIVEDVADPTHHFVTSGRHGVFEYRNDKLVAQYTQGNSPIESCSSSKSHDFVRTDAALMDSQGNLFVANDARDTVIWCRKPSGKWIPFYYPTISNAGNMEKSIIDSKGRLWFVNRRYDGNCHGGVLRIDYGASVDDTSDDDYAFVEKFVNQDNTSFSFQVANCLAQDKDDRIWIGTDGGLVVVDDPDQWSESSSFRITQVKVPRNDGTNYADYLLSAVNITAIAIDGANRKWIGTAGDGVYFLSPDGITQYHHFTKENSPLISNNIHSIVCHPKSGEVFIATDLGMLSYQSDASEAESALSRDNLRVYPNPVRPDYNGPIVLDGLVYDCDVKVVAVGGQAVAAGTSNGGTFTWDGRGSNGQRVASGVYHFMITTSDGKETVAAKVAVIR